MSLNIFVTGGTGFVGYYIVRRLLSAGHQITVLARKENIKARELQTIDPGVRVVYGDISDFDLLTEICLGQDVIVHAAAIVSFDPSIKKYILQTNVDGTIHLVNAALAASVKKFIYISSISTLSHSIDDHHYKETIPWNPKINHSVYALSKHAAEMEVWRGSAEGLEVGILNPSVVLGRWDSTHHSMQLFEKMKKSIAFYPSGSTGWVDVRDVAESVHLYLEKCLVNEQIIINGHNVSYREVMNKIAKAFGKKSPRYALSKRVASVMGGFYTLFNRWPGNKGWLSSGIINSLYTPHFFDHSKSDKLLGIQYHELDETIDWVIQSKY
ncbi:MAG: NAD-dependent epimerase/dehydratase family protein [Saprospiraceae bacterium]|nr:NAD-dependent epimerase/dehydratase family protein [Saprospiraceae bacterium]